MRVSNPTSREVGPPLSYLGGCWGFCIGRPDKERNSAPLPVIEDHLPHSPQVGLSTLKHCRKMPNSNNQAASHFGGTSLSQLSVTTLPRFILHTAHTHVSKKKKVHTQKKENPFTPHICMEQTFCFQSIKWLRKNIL